MGGLEGVALFIAFTQLRFVLELPCQHGGVVLIQPPAWDQGVVSHEDGVYVCLRTTQHDVLTDRTEHMLGMSSSVVDRYMKTPGKVAPSVDGQSPAVIACAKMAFERVRCLLRHGGKMLPGAHALKAARTAGSVKNSSRSSLGLASPSTWSTYHCTCVHGLG